MNQYWNGKATDVWYIAGRSFVVQQNRFARSVWEKFLKTEQFDVAVEIGTARGGFTALVAQHVSYIASYDIQTHPELQKLLYVNYQIADVLRETHLIVDELWTSEHQLLICDGGNKPLEIQTFSRYLKPNDVVAVHDYAEDRETFERLKSWGWFECQRSDVPSGLKLIDGFERTGWGVFRVE